MEFSLDAVTASKSAAAQSVRGEDSRQAQAAKQGSAKSGDSVELSPEAKRTVDKLKATDQKVRAHEAAHMTAGGGVVRGGPSYTYQRGPDGQMYAVGGEVSIDTSPVQDNPRATIVKAQRIQAAALAPADPSPQDRSVAATAAQMMAQASAQLLTQNKAKTTGTSLDLTA